MQAEEVTERHCLSSLASSSDDDYVDASRDGDRIIPYLLAEEQGMVEELAPKQDNLTQS